MLSLNSSSIAPGLSDTQMNDLKSVYQNLAHSLSLKEGLSDRESRRLMRLSRENLLFVHDSVDAIQQLPELCPRFLDPALVEAESNYFNQLRYLQQLHEQVGAALNDMRLRLGDKCYRNGLQIYNSVQSAAMGGYPKARPIYKQMKKRFPRTTNPVVFEVQDESPQNSDIVEDAEVINENPAS